jgi:hypothetical protein
MTLCSMGLQTSNYIIIATGCHNSLLKFKRAFYQEHNEAEGIQYFIYKSEINQVSS